MIVFKVISKILKPVNLNILVFLFYGSLHCQQNNYINQILEENFTKLNIPVLSQSEMYADFDTLNFLLKYIYPYYDIKSQLYSTDFDEILLELRTQIPTVRQPDDFVWILFKAMNLFCDKHLEIPHPQILNYYHKNEDKFITKLTPENIVYSYKYYLITHDSLYIKMKLGMRFKYIDNSYYNLNAFKYKEQIYSQGIFIKSIDEIPIDVYINDSYSSIAGLSYDYKNKKYFSDWFSLSQNFVNKETHFFVFEDDRGNIIKDTFNINITVEGLAKKPEQEDFPSVFAILDSFLYVRLPIMDDAAFYKQELQKQYNDNIKKIIIDIRGNRGGMDKVWKEIISSIVSDTIQNHVTYYANDNKKVRNYLLNKAGFDSIKIEYLSLLKSYKIKVIDEQNNILPNESSISFKGKIIILQDENTFSAAGSLLTVAKKEKNIISIGYSMNDLGGRGLTPLLFELPHTKMLIRIPFIIDYSDIKQLTDFIKGSPEIECKKSISTFLKNYYSTNNYLLQSLLQDECFLMAISL